MPKSSEEISKNKSTAVKTDSNIANDALHLGGIPAEDFATQSYVQQYHDSKEELQKEYIDNQDENVLSDSKLYTDTVVANQDFSRFAKLTDVDRVDTELTSKINNDISNLSGSVDDKIDVLTGSVNSLAQQTNQNINRIDSEIYTINQTELPNIKGRLSTAETNISNISSSITSINNDIDSLENTTEQLFTSVSSGKRKVATAITDKGVTTASDATFDTMANNIRQIETGIDTSDASAVAEDVMLGKTAYAKGRKIIGVHIDSGIDTSDATATADDIMFGKTAYADGSKIYGVHTDLDTSDATATQDDIAIGKSAYINGSKVYGSHIETGIDTTDATATPYDIAVGKTAYVNGEKITGLLDMSGTTPTYCSDAGIEKIYGGGTGNYDIGSISARRGNDIKGILFNDSYNSVDIRTFIRYDFTNIYFDEIDGHTSTVDITSVKQSTLTTLKQYADYADINAISMKLIGATKLNTSNPYIAMHAVPENANTITKESMLVLLPLVEIHTPSSGGGYYVEWNVDFNNIVYHTMESEVAGKWYSNYKLDETGRKIVILHNDYGNTRSSLYSFIFDINIDDLSIREHSFLANVNTNIAEIQSISIDRAIICNTWHYDMAYSYTTTVILLTSSYSFITTIEFNKKLTFTSDARFCVSSDGTIYSVGIDWYNNDVNLTEIASFPGIFGSGVYVELDILGDEYVISNDNEGNANKIFYFSPTSSEQLTLLMEDDYKIKIPRNSRKCSNLIWCYDSSSYVVRYIRIKPSYQKLIGLKYDGEYYYKQQYGLFTAGQPDVKYGKSFIGWMGYPEIGTMQVQNENEGEE